MFYFSKVAFRILFTVLVLEVSNSEKPNDQKDVNVKDIAEEWFTKQATGSLGKKFLEKVKCKKFITYFQENYPQVYLSSSKYSNDEISSVCEKQRQIERDRRDLQDYAVRYFKDPEETELSSCAEFAEDFLSEYPRFKGEKGEAEAYCYHFREEGSLKSLRQVQQNHKEKTRTMQDAIKTAKEIHEESLNKDQDL